MNRLQYIVTQIDCDLEQYYFKEMVFKGLCEHVIKDDKTVPVKYKGFGDNEFVGFDDSNGINLYHRLIDMNESHDNEAGFGNSPKKTEEYLMRLVVFGNQRDVLDVDHDINFKVSDEIGSLIPNRLNKTRLAEIEAQTGVINLTSADLNKTAVWELELPDHEVKTKPETLLFAINYTIKLVFVNSCKTVNCE